MAKISAHLNSSHDNYYTEVNAREHRMILDEPLEKSGGNMGASPFEHLSASLAGCTAITIKMYLDRKGWEVEGIDVNVERKINAADQQNIFEVEVAVKGELDEKQMGRILHIAKVCPVHKLLERASTIRTKIIS